MGKRFLARLVSWEWGVDTGATRVAAAKRVPRSHRGSHMNVAPLSLCRAISAPPMGKRFVTRLVSWEWGVDTGAARVAAAKRVPGPHR